jgi:hypothetical protein
VTRGEDDDVCNFLARWLTSESDEERSRERGAQFSAHGRSRINHQTRSERGATLVLATVVDAWCARAGIALHCMHALSESTCTMRILWSDLKHKSTLITEMRDSWTEQ